MNTNFDFFHWNHTICEIGEPVDLTKSDDPDKPKLVREEFSGVPVAKVVGLVAASGRDFQGEDIDQVGIDWSYFRKSGWINYEHQGGMENVVGYPDPDGIEEAVDAEGNPATRVTMWILLDKRGTEIYNKMRFLQKAGGSRQFGFSIEGQALERDPANPKRITKCRIKNVAITAHPVRDTARVEMVKSLASLATIDLAQTQIPENAESAESNTSGTPTLSYKTADENLRTMLPDHVTSQPVSKTITYEDLCGRLRKAFPRMDETSIRKAARRLIDVAKARAKTVA